MVNINTIYVYLHTRYETGAGTNGDVYVGIGGREFSIDSSDEDYNDFEEGNQRTYILGEKPPLVPADSTTVLHSTSNDPRKPYALKTENLFSFPAYVRFVPDDPADEDDYWGLDEIVVTVNPTILPNIKYSALGGNEYLWFGYNWGYTLYLSPERIIGSK